MKFPVALFLTPIWLVAASAQIVDDSYKHFPKDSEFPEIHAVRSEESFSDSKRLSKVEEGQLISDVGFDSYARRTYSVSANGDLSVEVIELRDSRAAYSLLTLLRNSSIRDGPPGDVYTSNADGLCFAQGNKWIRIRSRSIPDDLPMRIAFSISTRIGGRQNKFPSLISHLPESGYDASSLKYFPSSKSFLAYSVKKPPDYLKLDWDPEIAQARYSVGNQIGILFLLSFPTWQIAEQYHSEMAEWVESSEDRIYSRRVGPLLGILEGSFYPDTADKILSSITYKYSIQWITEKSANAATVWGIPVTILRTVVKSVFLVVLLGGFSVLAGVAIAAIRLALRSYAPNNPLDRPDRTEITQLRL